MKDRLDPSPEPDEPGIPYGRGIITLRLRNLRAENGPVVLPPHAEPENPDKDALSSLTGMSFFSYLAQRW